MKISSVKVDVVKVEEGVWVENIPELEGVKLRVRGAGNRDWKRMMQRLVASVPRQKRRNGNIDPDEMERILGTVMLETGLLDWSGIEGDDDKPIPYSKEKAKEYLLDPQWQVIRDGVSWACNFVGRDVEEAVEDISGN